jgi:hypothetical protein
MLTKMVLVVVVGGIGATVPTLAHDDVRIFQYSPIARLEGEGQYRAEVWRRETASDKEERAWSSSDLHGSSEQAIAAACTTLRESFASPCTQTSHNAKPGKTAGEAESERGSVFTQKIILPSKAPPANAAIPAPKEVAAAASPAPTHWPPTNWAPTNWAKKFWANSSQQRM